MKSNKGDKDNLGGRIRAKFLSWSVASGTHGYPNLFRTEHTAIRIVWLVAILGSVATCSYLVVDCFIEYFAFETTSKIEVIYESFSTMPAITVCLTNYFVAPSSRGLIVDHFSTVNNRAMTRLQDYDDIYNISRSIETILPRVFTLKQMLASPAFNDSQRKQIGFNRSEFLMECKLGRNDCDPNSIVWYFDYNFGNCYRINTGYYVNGSKDHLFSQKETGYFKGIKLNIFTGVFDSNFNNMFLTEDSYGVIVSIENQTSLPIATSSLVLVRPGTCAHIVLKKTLYQNLPVPYSTCKDSNTYHGIFRQDFLALKLSYLKKACILFCKQLLVTNKCRCLSTLYPKIKTNVTAYCNSRREAECFDEEINKFDINSCQDFW
jgi:hypothetical protein